MFKNKKDDTAGIAFVAFFFVGMAAGAYLHRWDIAPFAGLALGFTAMLAVKLFRK